VGVAKRVSTNRIADSIPAPDNFGANAFDDAEESIKYMVLTST
jgi:hypothetical protein